MQMQTKLIPLLAGKKEETTWWVEKTDEKLKIQSKAASSQAAIPSPQLAAARFKDLKARLQLHGAVYTFLSLPALLLPLCSHVILSLSAD